MAAPAGVWAYLGLRRRGLAPLELVSCELLGWALTWRHRIGRDGVDTEIGLGDGRHITGAAVRGWKVTASHGENGRG